MLKQHCWSGLQSDVQRNFLHGQVLQLATDSLNGLLTGLGGYERDFYEEGILGGKNDTPYIGCAYLVLNEGGHKGPSGKSIQCITRVADGRFSSQVGNASVYFLARQNIVYPPYHLHYPCTVRPAASISDWDAILVGGRVAVTNSSSGVVAHPLVVSKHDCWRWTLLPLARILTPDFDVGGRPPGNDVMCL